MFKLAEEGKEKEEEAGGNKLVGHDELVLSLSLFLFLFLFPFWPERNETKRDEEERSEDSGQIMVIIKQTQIGNT